MKATVMLATFPFGGSEHPASSRWLAKLQLQLQKDKRVGSCLAMDVDDTPITMSRNRVLKAALDKGVDYLLMLDSDMAPDHYLGMANDVKPFWESSFGFLWDFAQPAVIASPYCGPPPHENVYIFRWANLQSDQPNPDFRLEQYPREEATMRAGIERVAALPTGVFLMDMRVLNAIGRPWFEYEYEDPPFNTKKATTEDVFFTRNLSLAGVPCFVNWDAWSGHVKRKIVGRPTIVTNDMVQDHFCDALKRRVSLKERLVDIPPGGLVFSPGRMGGVSMPEPFAPRAGGRPAHLGEQPEAQHSHRQVREAKPLKRKRAS